MIRFKGRFTQSNAYKVGGYRYPSLSQATISGNPTVGSTLTASVIALGRPAPTLTYQWLRNGAPITNATQSTYVVVLADAGALVTLRLGVANRYGKIISTTTGVTPVQTWSATRNSNTVTTSRIFAGEYDRMTSAGQNISSLRFGPYTPSPSFNLSSVVSYSGTTFNTAETNYATLAVDKATDYINDTFAVSESSNQFVSAKSPQGDYIYMGSRTNTTTAWTITSFRVGADFYPRNAKMSRDGGRILVCVNDVYEVWDLNRSTNAYTKTRALPTPPGVSWTFSPSAAMSANGLWAVASIFNSTKSVVYDLSTGAYTATVLDSGIVTLNADGSIAYVGNTGGGIKMYKRTGSSWSYLGISALGLYNGSTTYTVRRMVTSDDGKLLVAAVSAGTNTDTAVDELRIIESPNLDTPAQTAVVSRSSRAFDPLLYLTPDGTTLKVSDYIRSGSAGTGYTYTNVIKTYLKS